MLLLDSTISIYRLRNTSGNKTSYMTFTVSIESTKQPLGDEKVGFYGGSFGKTFKIFLDPGIDIKEGDQVRDPEGNIYQVAAGGIERRNDGFITDYIGVVVKQISNPDRF